MSVPDMEDSYAKVRRPDDPQSLRDYLDLQDSTLFQQSAFEIAKRMIRHRNVIHSITEMKWSIVHLDAASFELLASDRPVVMSPQLGLEDSHILLPIGARRLFIAVGSRERSRRLRSRTHDQLATMVNRAVVSMRMAW